MIARRSKRRVGVEIEFAGLTALQAVEIIATAPGVGGKAVFDGPHAAHLEGGVLDGARVELDSRYARQTPEEDADFIDGMLEAFNARDMAAEAVSLITPVELSAPPLLENKLPVIDSAIEALRKAGATGTKDAPFAAYGLHLNVELVPPEPTRAVSIAAAYAFAEEWLRDRVAPDLSRRATPYVDPYPVPFTYELSVLLRKGDLNLASFIQLYGFWCPTRNHGLDMWPLLGFLDAEAAARATSHKIRGARPAFHYRLPNCDLTDPDWTPRDDLDLWLRIERIGDDPERLERARATWIERVSWRIGAAEYKRRIDELGA